MQEALNVCLQCKRQLTLYVNLIALHWQQLHYQPTADINNG